LKIRQLKQTDSIPYNLLLLADETVAAIDKYINECDIYIFESKQEIIAVYALHATNAETMEVKNIAVKEPHRGQGVGKLLLEDACKKAIDKGYKLLIIGTGDVAIRQIDLYKKVGFEIYGKRNNFFIDNYPKPIFENGVQLKDMIMLRKIL
jgi:aminoglycoside 6'-N-acetyltransferase I